MERIKGIEEGREIDDELADEKESREIESERR